MTCFWILIRAALVGMLVQPETVPTEGLDEFVCPTCPAGRDIAMPTVADNIVATLKASGVRRIYGIPGDSLNGFTDARWCNGKIAWGARLPRGGKRVPMRTAAAPACKTAAMARAVPIPPAARAPVPLPRAQLSDRVGSRLLLIWLRCRQRSVGRRSWERLHALNPDGRSVWRGTRRNDSLGARGGRAARSASQVQA